MQSVYSLTPLTAEAKDWIGENVLSGGQWLGGTLVVEHRYIADIVSAMLEEGLTLNEDFLVD